MNKRIRKKNDINRINEKFRWAWTIHNRYYHVYEKCAAYCCIDYVTWYKSNNAKRCWSYIIKKYGYPKWVGYKNKTIRH
jgi:hypothetical protein